MKAVTVFGAGDLRVVEVEDPQAGSGQVRVAMEWGGICGSDLGYWKHGATGTAILREPLVLGHEVAGRIDQIGDGVEGLEIGQAVTFNPATLVGDHVMPAHLEGRDNLWPEVRYFGSAAFLPHEQGGFSTYRVVRAEQIRPLPDSVSTRHGAVAEPLGVELREIAVDDQLGQFVAVADDLGDPHLDIRVVLAPGGDLIQVPGSQFAREQEMRGDDDLFHTGGLRVVQRLRH